MADIIIIPLVLLLLASFCKLSSLTREIEKKNVKKTIGKRW